MALSWSAVDHLEDRGKEIQAVAAGVLLDLLLDLGQVRRQRVQFVNGHSSSSCERQSVSHERHACTSVLAIRHCAVDRIAIFLFLKTS